MNRYKCPKCEKNQYSVNPSETTGCIYCGNESIQRMQTLEEDERKDDKIMKFRKKPVVIEAVKYLREENISSCMDFCPEMIYEPTDNEYYIKTLEGNMKVSKGDYIIKGVQDEFYPCKPDIFEQTYETVDEEEDTNTVLPSCENCKWAGRVRPQKCACCRRCKSLKDNYEKRINK